VDAWRDGVAVVAKVFEVEGDGLADVVPGLGPGCSLGDAAWQNGTRGDEDAVFVRLELDAEFHG
jgi:hypothetical protein